MIEFTLQSNFWGVTPYSTIILIKVINQHIHF